MIQYDLPYIFSPVVQKSFDKILFPVLLVQASVIPFTLKCSSGALEESTLVAYCVAALLYDDVFHLHLLYLKAAL